MARTYHSALRELILLNADELARVYDDARARGKDVVVLLADRQDSLGRQICDQFGWKEDLNVRPLPREEVLDWLDGVPELVHLAAQLAPEDTQGGELGELSAAVAGAMMSVLVIAHETATLEHVALE